MSLATIVAGSGTCPHCGPCLAQKIGSEDRLDWERCTSCGAEWATGPAGWLRMRAHQLGQRWREAFPSSKALIIATLWIALALVLNLVTGCATPRIEYVDRPVPEYIDRFVYVAIPDELVPDYTIATGPLEQCPAVASDRKLELEKARSHATAIRAIRGTEVPATK